MKTLALARVSASACTSPSEGSPVHRMAYTSHPQFLWDFTRNRAEGNAALSAARIWTAACLRGTWGVSFVMPLLRTIASVPAARRTAWPAFRGPVLAAPLHAWRAPQTAHAPADCPASATDRLAAGPVCATAIREIQVVRTPWRFRACPVA